VHCRRGNQGCKRRTSQKDPKDTTERVHQVRESKGKKEQFTEDKLRSRRTEGTTEKRRCKERTTEVTSKFSGRYRQVQRKIQASSAEDAGKYNKDTKSRARAQWKVDSKEYSLKRGQLKLVKTKEILQMQNKLKRTCLCL
jgi:hypothetical protein